MAKMKKVLGAKKSSGGRGRKEINNILKDNEAEYIRSNGKMKKIAMEDEIISTVNENGVVRWLGGSVVVGTLILSNFDYITAGSFGITKTSIDKLAAYMGVTRKMMAEEILDLSVKTLERKAPGEKLDKKTSSHALEIARVMQHAFEIFQDDEKVKGWMNTENKALKGMKPVQLMDTLTGLNMINDILGRIEEGVYS